jgi:TetR/AcrR family transcriptional regulator, transcriptional repressor for nem operon
MARAKEFDREQALERAMHVFWARGYEATSLPELLEAMQIGRQSMYDTFGDKRALFIAALGRYIDRSEAAFAAVEQAPSAKRAIREIFEGIANESAKDKRRGCLGVLTTVELAPHDPEIAKLIAGRQRALEELFFRALERARATGEIAKAKDARGLARFLVGAMQGLRVAASGDPASPALRDIVRYTLQTLD